MSDDELLDALGVDLPHVETPAETYARAGAVLGSGEAKHGGARPGAGRKPTFDVTWLLRLSKGQREKVKSLGGADWLRGVIDRA